MRYTAPILLLLASHRSCLVVSTDLPPPTAAITSAGADNAFTATPQAPRLVGADESPSSSPTARVQVRQDTAATSTTADVSTSITTLPPSTSSEDDDDGAATSTMTITITSNRTTTIRPTVTVTSLFSPTTSATSGARGGLEAPRVLGAWVTGEFEPRPSPHYLHASLLL
ncbi:hypothetical protein F4802DRAFT_597262 [Xylaria palmicola]|nr:hypothetical protein F4802DRAFT_597262 [Xylaria palmicola]